MVEFIKRTAPCLVVVLLASLIVGCLGASLSEEAKPQTPAEHFVVKVQEYRLLADQATEWLAGITAAAQAGDPAAAQYESAAREVGQVLQRGAQAIQLGAAALAAGDGEGLERHSRSLDYLITQLQAQAFASVAER